LRYPHDVKQASSYASDAFERIQNEGLPPAPDVFEVWYIYFSRLSPDITRAIDIMMANNQKITADACRELYQRFLNNVQNEERVRDVGSQLNSTIKDVTGAVKNVRDATSSYSGTLEGVTAKLEQTKSLEDLEVMIRSVVHDTADILVKNKELESKLDSSSHAMETLQRDLETIRREALTGRSDRPVQ